jgi:hypothetical protein
MTRDQQIRDMRTSRGTWPALVAVYAILLGTLFLTASAIV